jgi:uncharacterized membrane protein required for colicin V production
MSAPVVIALVVIGFFGFMGWRDGVVRRVVEIVGALATLVLTARFAAAVQPSVAEATGLSESTSLLVTWAGLVLAGLLLSRLLGILVSKLLRLTVLGWLDRGGGAVLGMALGLLVASVLLVALAQVPGADGVQASCEESAFGQFVFYAAPDFYTQVRRLSGGRVEEVWQRTLDRAKDGSQAAREKLDETVDEAQDEIEDQVRERTSGN